MTVEDLPVCNRGGACPESVERVSRNPNLGSAPALRLTITPMVRPCFLILSRYFLIQVWLTIKKYL